MVALSEESVQTTLEEASRCPRCTTPGKPAGQKLLGRESFTKGAIVKSAKLLIFECVNERCKWYTTTWTVQVNSDGTIPPPSTARRKQFTALPSEMEKRIVEALNRQSEVEVKPGAEFHR